MTYYADLHIHTVFSDGTMTPYEIVEEAHKKKISVISITDHDTTSGIKDALDAGKKFNISVIPGVELTANYDREIHILGYFVNVNSEDMQNYFKLKKEKEVFWVVKTMKKLRKLNFYVDIDCFLQALFGESCRPKMANVASPFWRMLHAPLATFRHQ